MCFPYERYSKALLEFDHLGFECLVTTNGTGFRCGYIRLPVGHPWHGKSKDSVPAFAPNGGVTFAKPDVPCDKAGDDDAWWIGFSSNALTDEPDHNIVHPDAKELVRNQQKLLVDQCKQLGYERKPGMTTEEAEQHTKMLAAQAALIGLVLA